MEKAMQYAYEIYLQKSFSKAAEKLYISQPSLSAIVKKLEQELNTTLFDRSTKPLRLTAGGEYYLRCAEQIMAVEHSMKDYFDDLNELKTGRISIGASTYFCSNILPSLMKSFSQKYPGIQFSVTEDSYTPNLKKALRKGGIDLAMSSNTYPENEFDCRIYEREALILAVPAAVFHHARQESACSNTPRSCSL